MVSIPLRRLAPRALPNLLLTAFLAVQTQAQAQTTPATRPDPLDPTVQVPATRYESSFGRVRRIGDDKPVPWRDANEAVARIGGWKVHAREAQQPDPAPSTAPASAPAGHGVHKP